MDMQVDPLKAPHKLLSSSDITLFYFLSSLAPVEPPTHQSSPATTQSTANIAVASWGEGVVGTSSHELQSKGVVSSRGVQHEVKSSKDMYPSLKPKTPDPNKNSELYTDFARVTPIPTQPKKEQAAVTIQRYSNLK